MECIINYALTHETVIEKVRVEQGVTDELVSMLRKHGADLFHEHHFGRHFRRGDIIYPHYDCSLTFKDLTKVFRDFGFSLPQIHISYLNDSSIERIIIGKDVLRRTQDGKYIFDEAHIYVILTRIKDSGDYYLTKISTDARFVNVSLEDTLRILEDIDHQFETVLSKKGQPLESQNRWWDMYKTYAEYMGSPQIKNLILKVLYNNDPSKMIGGKLKRPRQTLQSNPKRIR
jgi:hypothetical protein